METPIGELTEKQRYFFDQLQSYIELPIYYYGSINRPDYIPGKSDIDIDIFSPNEESTIQKICSKLGLQRSQFRKVVYKINSTVVYGFKGKYVDSDDSNDPFQVEIAVYNDKYKNVVLADHNSGIVYPFYITILLMFLKFLFYNLEILPKSVYKRCKQFLMNPGDEMKFIEME